MSSLSRLVLQLGLPHRRPRRALQARPRHRRPQNLLCLLLCPTRHWRLRRNRQTLLRRRMSPIAKGNSHPQVSKRTMHSPKWNQALRTTSCKAHPRRTERCSCKTTLRLLTSLQIALICCTSLLRLNRPQAIIQLSPRHHFSSTLGRHPAHFFRLTETTLCPMLSRP